MKNIIWLLVALVMATTSCNRKPKAIDPASKEAVKTQVNILRDSVRDRWSEMVTSDDDKIRNVQQVLVALEAQPGTDRAQLEGLQRATARLKDRRYTQESMAESARIDAYDSAQDSLLQIVYRIALPTDRQPTESVKALTDKIQDADGQLVGFRVRYDQAATRLNNYLQVHTAELDQLGGQYSKLKPLPLFTLQE
ncbi:hypothetical protein HMJ29_20215 [Hymenobacter taeanensis]|uniref:LemA family protein n=1 Tax=Hymenobacter taeanensis TaxID=2735321 RepID=A0A6M6BMQ9_9BACT|nr:MULTISPECIES: hypothetical protein [Hymenobacter]QJX49104.1 hypothetical protein HMJ29_20215 [Hymenobacter taeanensis]UOQ81372.1 hypothetical protein MUN83_00785 [Hymenobacter sp. 5414T-23]